MKTIYILLISVALIGVVSAIRLPQKSAHSRHPDCPYDEPLAFWPHETECNLFYTCSHGEVTLYECDFPLHFNPSLDVCDYPENAGCQYHNVTTTSTEGPTTPECRSSNIHFGSHESDCSKFYVYISGNPYLLHCKLGYEFDASVQDCVKISKNGCIASKMSHPYKNNL